MFLNVRNDYVLKFRTIQEFSEFHNNTLNHSGALRTAGMAFLSSEGVRCKLQQFDKTVMSIVAR
jgi:hypothetical protein